MKKQFVLALAAAGVYFGQYAAVCAEDARPPAAHQQQVETHNALIWKDNSRAMFDKVIQSTPDFVRPLSEPRLREAVTAKAGASRTVTEDMVIECTKELTPAPFLEQTLKDLEALRTPSSF